MCFEAVRRSTSKISKVQRENRIASLIVIMRRRNTLALQNSVTALLRILLLCEAMNMRLKILQKTVKLSLERQQKSPMMRK